jgi:ubiquinone/menaquinone biosynthesis C-methylase UbiE
LRQTFDFDRGDIADRYDRGRSLPAATLDLWLDEIGARLPAGATRILDLGCGTGRFTAPLARRFSIHVCGLDVSANMLAVANETLADLPATLVRASAEALPFREGQFDAILISMVLHHIRLRPHALDESRRVLRRGSPLLVRTSSVETMDSYLWPAFFPEAAAVEASRVMARKAIEDLLAGHGFTVAEHRVLDQIFAADLVEYCGKIAERTLSSLAAISDRAFDKGLAALRRHCALSNESTPVYESVDFFVFR